MSKYLLFSGLFAIGCGAVAEKNSGDCSAPTELSGGVNPFCVDQTVEGETVGRSFLIHTSDNFDSAAALPLVFAFHGNGGSGDNFTQQLKNGVEHGDFIGVYPNGIANSWNLGREDSTADDVAFVESILTALGDVPGIDTSRPVAMGFSNGAGFVHKLAMDSDQFAGISPAASQLLVDNMPQSEDPKVSVLQFHGTEDNVVPYDGGVAVMGHNFMPAEDGAAAWAEHNGCDPSVTETESGSHNRMEWDNCSNGVRVVHYKLNGVGHELPPDIEGDTMELTIDFLLNARE